jgi:uncharacterized damage-inducible protein DinB
LEQLRSQQSIEYCTRQQIIRDWERAKTYTQQYLNAMPADKYGFRPTDSVRSFAEQMLHIAQPNVGMAVLGLGYQDLPVQQMFMRANFEKSPSDSVMYYVNKSYDFMINAIRNLDMGKMYELVTREMPGGKRTATRLGWLLKAFEHQTHHRGQCTMYFRLQGIRPPGELLWDQ